MNFYQRKLYALLRSPEYECWGDAVLSQLQCLDNHHENLRNWWDGNNGNAEITINCDTPLSEKWV